MSLKALAQPLAETLQSFVFFVSFSGHHTFAYLHLLREKRPHHKANTDCQFLSGLQLKKWEM
jgi:hypothetical protein